MIEDLVSVQRWLYQGMASGMKEAGDLDSLLALLALAFAFGAIHALMPGHGKTVLVSYHLGRAGRVTDGLVNGTLLVLTHVGSAVILVLAGITIIRRTLGPSDQANAVEIVSSALILIVGLWLLWRAARPHRHDQASGPMLAFVTGLVPCPLTTFVMSYSVVNDRIALGLIVVSTMAIGMVATIGGFAATAILARSRLVGFLERSETWRRWTAQALEFLGAAGIVALGAWGLIHRAACPPVNVWHALCVLTA
jgi:ABC-type nickel/cobalt efflux system permease component RcnA